MMTRILVLVLFFAACGISNAADRTLFDRMDVFELEWVSSPQISPDGRRVVYNRNSMEVMADSATSRLWIINTNGTGNAPLTGRDIAESGAVWSPDGSRIAFTSRTENGSEIHVYWLANGKTARLTQLDRSPNGLSWSPDGQQIAFSMLVPEAPPVLVSPPIATHQTKGCRVGR